MRMCYSCGSAERNDEIDLIELRNAASVLLRANEVLRGNRRTTERAVISAERTFSSFLLQPHVLQTKHIY